MITVTVEQAQKALSIISWLPRPLYSSEGGSKPGPGLIRLNDYGLIGYTALHNIARQRPTKNRDYLLAMEELYAVMLRERAVVKRREPPRLAPPASRPAPSSIVVVDDIEEPQFPDLNELEERLDAMRAVQKQQGETLLALRQMLERLMKELGVK